MPRGEISKISITDADIDEIEHLLHVQFDDQRRKIIKCMDDLMVQAFPGTGKTTVLIAKLAILGKKWPYSNHGICVLSHTNVAREEIVKRLGSFGESLLSYPNFIGTIHSFFDTFVTLPWLKSNGYKVRLIDTDTVLVNRFHHLSYSTYSYFNHKYLDEQACESLSFPEISVDIHCKNTAQSYIDVCNCIKRSMEDGYFTFKETLYIAKYALEQSKFLPTAIQTRFPIVLIDEFQDTSSILWKLINSTFPKGSSVCQLFGDTNQAIFQSMEDDVAIENMLELENNMTISNSHRFGEGIAHLADSIGVTKGISGSSNTFKHLDNKHMIFLFDDASKVLPAYAEYILSCFTDEELNCELDCYAVGMVHNKDVMEQSEKKYPGSVKDYYFKYNPYVANISFEPQSMIEFFMKGKAAVKEEGSFYLYVDNIAKGLRKYIMLNTDLDISINGRAIKSLLRMIPDELRDKFRVDLYMLCKLPITKEEDWNTVVFSVRKILNIYFKISLDEIDNTFLRWSDIYEYDEKMNLSNMEDNQNIFIYQKDGRMVRVKISSIHGVKGMTHLSTLVLDTFWYERNIESILPWLCGNKVDGDIGKRNLTRLRCHYVAMTRASGLVCMAIPKRSVDEKIKELLSQTGWIISEL